MKAVIDKELCVGCGLCASSCPDVYAMEGALAVTVSETVPEGVEECAKKAAGECPVAAIIIG